MEAYNQMIAYQLQQNQQKMLHHLAQPEMFSRNEPKLFGGKRTRQFVLSGSNADSYPASLAVGAGTESGMYPNTMGGSFWTDLGDTAKSVGKVAMPVITDVGKEMATSMAKDALASYMKGGAAMEAKGTYPFPPYHTDVAVKRGRGRPPKKVGAGMWDDIKSGLSSVGSVVAPVVTPIVTDMAKDALMSYMKKGAGRKPKALKGGSGMGDFLGVMKAAAPFLPLLLAAGRESGGHHDKYMHVAAQMHHHLNGGDGMSSFLDIAKTVAPMLPLLLGLGRGEGRPVGGALLSSAYKEVPKGGARVKSAKQIARGQLVSKLMRENGMSLGQASKYIKENSLM